MEVSYILIIPTVHGVTHQKPTFDEFMVNVMARGVITM